MPNSPDKYRAALDKESISSDFKQRTEEKMRRIRDEKPAARIIFIKRIMPAAAIAAAAACLAVFAPALLKNNAPQEIASEDVPRMAAMDIIPEYENDAADADEPQRSESTSEEANPMPELQTEDGDEKSIIINETEDEQIYDEELSYPILAEEPAAEKGFSHASGEQDSGKVSIVNPVNPNSKPKTNHGEAENVPAQDTVTESEDNDNALCTAAYVPPVANTVDPYHIDYPDEITEGSDDAISVSEEHDECVDEIPEMIEEAVETTALAHEPPSYKESDATAANLTIYLSPKDAAGKFAADNADAVITPNITADNRSEQQTELYSAVCLDDGEQIRSIVTMLAAIPMNEKGNVHEGAVWKYQADIRSGNADGIISSLLVRVYSDGIGICLSAPDGSGKEWVFYTLSPDRISEIDAYLYALIS